MAYRVLSRKDAKIIAAMAGGMIPSGGASFELGADDIKGKWLARTDHMLSRMPLGARFALKLWIRTLNYAWPVFLMKRFRQFVNMDEQERTELLHLVENSMFPGPLSMMIIKVLVFPAFYGVDEAREAIGYRERFDNPGFRKLKD